MERTLSIIKPDAVARNITESINRILEEAGLRIVAQKRLQMTRTQANEFYAVHSDKPFYNDLCIYMSSGPIVVQVLEAPNAISLNRITMGATDPSKAEEKTIRSIYGKSIDHNSIHGSDSVGNAKKEIEMFFAPSEIC